MSIKVSPSEAPTVLRILTGEASLDDMRKYLPDWRAQALAEDFKTLLKTIDDIEDLLNPEVDAPMVLSESQLAHLYRAHFRTARAEVIEKGDRLTEALLAVLNALTRVSPAVLAQTNFEEKMSDISGSLLTLLQSLETNLTHLTTDPVTTDEILKGAAEVLSIWTQIKLLLNYRVVFPLKASITEEAKRNCIDFITPRPAPPVTFLIQDGGVLRDEEGRIYRVVEEEEYGP